MTSREKRVIDKAGVMALAIIIFVALLVVLATYDAEKDPTWHQHTADCAMHGCELIP